LQALAKDKQITHPQSEPCGLSAAGAKPGRFWYCVAHPKVIIFQSKPCGIYKPGEAILEIIEFFGAEYCRIQIYGLFSRIFFEKKWFAMPYIAEKVGVYGGFPVLRSADIFKYRSALMGVYAVGQAEACACMTRRGWNKLRSPLDDLDDI
jgi:hypothetical protein